MTERHPHNRHESPRLRPALYPVKTPATGEVIILDTCFHFTPLKSHCRIREGVMILPAACPVAFRSPCKSHPCHYEFCLQTLGNLENSNLLTEFSPSCWALMNIKSSRDVDDLGSSPCPDLSAVFSKGLRACHLSCSPFIFQTASVDVCLSCQC